MSSTPVPISAVIITRDAERLLARVLEALRWCDEILIVDSGSSDRTIEIATAASATILLRDFDGYGPQKAFAVSHARNDWVLAVDADEVVTPELGREIVTAVAAANRGESSYKGFVVPISLVFLGRLMRHGGESRMPHLRLFDRRAGNYNANRVHERVVVDGPVGRLRHEILHDSYGSLDAYFEKFNRYTTAGATDLASRGKTASIATIVLRFPMIFLLQYVIRGNWLNGYPGFLWSFLSGVYPVVKYAKLREMGRK